MRLVIPILAVLLLSPAAFADELTFLGRNEQGAAEYRRFMDGAIVIRIPGGPFEQRPYEGGPATETPKTVDVKAFAIDKYEVTNARFADFLNEHGNPVDELVDRSVPGIVFQGKWKAKPGMERHPVTAATGAGALAYAKWVGGAIPVRAQWEKAAGGPKGLVYPWGNEMKPGLAHGGRFKLKGLAPVGSYLAGVSPYGCHDMAGNAYDRVMMMRGGKMLPVLIKGGSWLSPHPLNLRVADMCVQPMEVAERSVGFRCVMPDPGPPPAEKPAPPKLKLAKSWEAAVAEAKRRHVPIFLSLQFDTCGQCDRTRAQLFADPRFIRYCNKFMVVAIGHKPAPNANLHTSTRRTTTMTRDPRRGAVRDVAGQLRARPQPRGEGRGQQEAPARSMTGSSASTTMRSTTARSTSWGGS